MNLLRVLPFSLPWLIRHHFGSNKKVLDVGCGDGSLMVKVNPDKKYKVWGVDLYKPSLKRAKESNVYDKLILKDLKKIKFKDKLFDIVLASQVIEHLKKTDSLKLIKKLEKIAKHKVILTTPKGFVEFSPFEATDNNRLQKHKSGWEIKELQNMGYKVYGQGNGIIYHPSGLLFKYRWLKNVFILISFLLSPLTYFIPTTSAYIIAVKEV